MGTWTKVTTIWLIVINTIFKLQPKFEVKTWSAYFLKRASMAKCLAVWQNVCLLNVRWFKSSFSHSKLSLEIKIKMSHLNSKTNSISKSMWKNCPNHPKLKSCKIAKIDINFKEIQSIALMFLKIKIKTKSTYSQLLTLISHYQFVLNWAWTAFSKGYNLAYYLTLVEQVNSKSFW